MASRIIFRSLLWLVLSGICTVGADEPVKLERPVFTAHRPNAANSPGEGPWAKLVMSHDDQWLAGGGSQLAVWNARTGKVSRAADAWKPLDGVAFSPDGKTIIGWSLAHDFRAANGLTPIHWWPPQEQQPLQLQIQAGESQELYAATVLDGGKKLITVAPDQTTLFDTRIVPITFSGRPIPNANTFPAGTIIPRDGEGRWADPAVLSRDGTKLGITDGTFVQIIDTATGKHVATSETRLGNREWKAFLALSANGSRGAVVIQPAGEDGATIVIFDGQSGATIATCIGHRAPIAALAMTPDGRWLVSGGDDQTARLWNTTSGQEVAQVTGAQQPVHAVAIRSDGKWLYTGVATGEVQAWSLPDAMDDAAPSTAVNDASPAAESVELPPENRAEVKWVEVPGVPFDRDQESLFLILSAQRLIDQCGPTSELPIDSLEAKQLVARAIARRDYVRAERFDEALAESFAAIPDLLAGLQKEASLRRQQMKEHADDVRKRIREQRESSQLTALNALFGLGLFVLGELPIYSNQYDPITRTTLTVETGTLSPVTSEFGLQLLLQGISHGLADQERLAAAESIGETVLRNVVENSLERQRELVDRYQSRLNPLLQKQLGGSALPALPALDRPAAKTDERVERTPERVLKLSDFVREARPVPKAPPKPKPRDPKEFQPLLDAQMQRATLIKEHLGRHDPFTVAAWYALHGTTQVAAKDRSEQWVALGQKVAGLSRQLPAGQVYDDDRAELLGIAADLILRAAMLDAERVSWTTVKSAKAEMALVLIEAALRLRPSDPTGLLREQQAIARALTGRWRQAYAVATELRTLRGDSQRFRFLMARLAFLNGQTEQSLNELSVAIERLGLSDIHSIRNCPDLPRQATRFKELTTIELEAISQTLLSGGTVQLINRSGFPLTNVKLQLKHPIPGRSWTSESYIAFLPPGEECSIAYHPSYAPDILPAGAKTQDKGKVTLQSDQGTTTTEVL